MAGNGLVVSIRRAICLQVSSNVKRDERIFRRNVERRINRELDTSLLLALNFRANIRSGRAM